ncbi:MAG: DUF2953 domain-containing protein [Fidelibacterota bacterium]
MVTVAFFLLGLLFLLITLLIVPWYVHWTLHLLVDPGTLSYATRVNLGFKNRGIGFSIRQGLRHVTLGKMDSPTWEKRLKGRKRSPRRKPKDILPPLRRGIRALGPNPVGRLTRLARSVRWVGFRIDGEMGLDDPAITGRVLGALWAVAGIIPGNTRQLEISPNFERRKIDLLCRFTLRVHPVVLLWSVVPLLWKFRRDEGDLVNQRAHRAG